MSIIATLPVILAGIIILCFVIAVVIVVVVIVVSSKKSKSAPPAAVDYSNAATAQSPVPEAAPIKLSLGETIKNHRVRCGMTQEYVAESLNVSRQAVSKWETDAAEPSTSNLLALAKLFGISAGELLESVEHNEN